jgi:acyl-coenzyme A thioesterase PaaI-like protein
METFGLAVAWIKPGEASVIMPIPEDATAGRGAPPPSLAALVADSACGNALVSAGHPRPALTVSLHIDILDALPRSGQLRGHARLSTPSEISPLYVEGVVTDADDRLVARCTSWWLAGRGGEIGKPPIARPAASIPPPVTARDLVDRFGLTSERGDGRATLTVGRVGGYLNRRRTLHGGVIGLLAELAAEEALASAWNELGRTLSLTVAYLAPTGMDGAAVTIEAVVVRAGLQIAVVESRLLTAAGDVAALVTVVRSR